MQIIMSFVAVVRSTKYYELRRQKTGSKVLCALLVALLTSLITIGLSGYILSKSEWLETMMRELP